MSQVKPGDTVYVAERPDSWEKEAGVKLLTATVERVTEKTVRMTDGVKAFGYRKVINLPHVFHLTPADAYAAFAEKMREAADRLRDDLAEAEGNQLDATAKAVAAREAGNVTA